jgi:signal transduction histidine kinase
MASSFIEQDFTKQVRSERLNTIWQLTVVVAVVLIWLSLIMSFSATGNTLFQVIIPASVVAAGGGLTGFFLRKGRYNMAVWAYTAGMLAAATFMLVPLTAGEMRNPFVPFALPLLITLVGLMMPNRATFIVLALAIAVTVLAPSIGQPLAVNSAQIAAIFMMFVAAAIAIQTAGEVYSIADWALASYEKERQTKEQLFDSQAEVQRSFVRQKVLADQLQSANVELEAARASAIEAKNFRGQFLANMSHELRTPLNAIIGFSETMLNYPMMYENQPLPDAYRADLNQIFTSGKSLLTLINDILDLSKVDAGRLEIESEEIELESLVKGVVSTAVGLVGEKPVRLVQELEANLPLVVGDSLRVRQVMLNLMSNAAKFTDTGMIVLSVKRYNDKEVIISIKDSGIGIPPEDSDKLFEEFRQGQSGRRKGRAGSGLGLAISRQLLNLMGGRIWFESKVNEGSTFYFTLPIFQEESAQQPAAAQN